MATVTITNPITCAGGGHLHVEASLNGGAAQGYAFDTDEMRAPLSELTEEERAAFVKVLLKIRLAGLTRAQARTVLLAGVTVTI